MKYILITPVRNEGKYLHFCIKNILSQTILPELWVIVDGDSNDGSTKILKNAEKKYDFIKIVNQSPILNAKGHLNFSVALNMGYLYAISKSKIENIKYDYVGKTDADVLLQENYFEKLGEKFSADPKLGVASGIAYTVTKDYIDYSYDKISEKDLIQERYLLDELPDKRLYKREFLDQIGGFPVTVYSPDTVLLAKARLKGWKVSWFKDVRLYNLRKDFGTKRTIWNAYKIAGERQYYLNYHPLLVLLSFLHAFIRPPHYTAFAMLLGYINQSLIKDVKINDKEIRDYFRKYRLKEIIHMKI